MLLGAASYTEEPVLLINRRARPEIEMAAALEVNAGLAWSECV